LFCRFVLLAFGFWELEPHTVNNQLESGPGFGTAQGESLPGAIIVATHEPSGTRYGAVSNLDGRFNIANIANWLVHTANYISFYWLQIHLSRVIVPKFRKPVFGE